MSDQHKPTVITIDDDAIILNTLLSILKPHYNVRPFSAGKTALKYLNSNPVNLVLLDCNMPGMNGFEVLANLQSDERTRDLPVIFLTGTEDGDSEVAALEKGAVDYILKPIKPKVLLTRVRQQMELQRYRRRLESLVEEKTENLRHAYEQLKLSEDTTLNILARTTDLRDSSTGDHIWRTTEFVRIIVDDLVLNHRDGYVVSPAKAEDIIKSSKLHDLGKIAVPDPILRKLGKLTADEFEIIKIHTTQGADLLDEFIEVLGDNSFIATARDIALCHHEKWNGSGYPQGLVAEEIPLSARIVAIADVYDALISVRPYKRSFTHEESMGIILADSGSHFDPYLVSIFEKHAEDFRQISMSTVCKTSHVDITHSPVLENAPVAAMSGCS